MEAVLILMSTFNGEKYLPEQLDSIISQNDVNIKLLIRDDGSTDSTMSILKDYKAKYPDKIDIESGSNIGWKKSFFHLVKLAAKDYSSFMYFAFSDQDDIWKPNKLKRALECLKTDVGQPSLYCSNMTYYKDGRAIGDIRKREIIPTPKNCLIRNYATGCTIVFNQSLLNKVANGLPSIPVAHDQWFYMVATLCGHVAVDFQSHILYRQHNANQIGSKRGFFEIWNRRLKSISSLLGKRDKEKTAKELLRLHSDSMNVCALGAVSKLANYRHSVKNRLALLFDNEYSYDKLSSDFWLKLRIIFGKL